MEGQRHRSAGQRRKKRGPRAGSNPEPVLIVARRPGAPPRPSTPRSLIAASAVPRSNQALVSNSEQGVEPQLAPMLAAAAEIDPAPKRAARIVQARAPSLEDGQTQRLLARLLSSEGTGAITRAAKALLDAGVEFPLEQSVQLQLLEHADERRAQAAVAALSGLLARERPIKRPVLEQRLRRLEEHAEDANTRDAAATLRRTLR